MTDELPEGWVLASVGQVAEYINGLPFKPADWETRGRPIIRIQNLTDPAREFNYTSKSVDSRFLVRAGEILVSWSATLDAFRWNGPDAVLNQHIFRVVPRAELVDADYLFHGLRLALGEMWRSEHTHGSTMRHINRGPFLAHPFPVPPLAEQRRIAQKVEALLADVGRAGDRLARSRLILKRFRQSVFAAACSGKLTEEWRAENPSPSAVAYLEERLGEQLLDHDAELPETWAWVRLGALMKSLRSGTTVPPTNERSAYPVLRSSSVRPGAIDLGDVKFLARDASTNPDNFLEEGDLLFTRLSGSLEYVANCAVVRDLDGRRIQYPDRLFRARLHEPRWGSYIEACFASPTLRRSLEVASKSSAGHQRISMGALTEFRIPFPPPVEQGEIVRRAAALLRLADDIAARVDRSATRVAGLTQAIRAKAVSGELVPTEADLAKAEGRAYERADELLRRVASMPDRAPPKRRRTVGKKPARRA